MSFSEQKNKKNEPKSASGQNGTNGSKWASVFTRNLFLKIFSLLVAAVLWIVIVNRQDPVITATIHNVPITVLNENYFSERDKVVKVESDLSVNITVSGSRSIVENMTADDLVATIDYLNVTPEEGKAEIVCTSKNRRVTIVRQSNTYIGLSIEDVVSKEVPVTLVKVGTPAEGYYLPEVDEYIIMEPSVVTLKGPQSQIADIERAQVTVNVDGASDEVTGKGKAIDFLDASGKTVVLDDREGVTASARLMSKLNVPLYVFKTISFVTPVVSPMEETDYYVGNITLTPESVTIYGPQAVLESIPGLNLAGVSTRGQTETIVKEYDLNAVLNTLSRQYGVTLGLAEGETQTAVLTVEMLEKASKTLKLTQAQMYFTGIPESYDFKLRRTTLPIEVKGRQDVISDLGITAFSVLVDLSGIEGMGEYSAPIQITAPAGVDVVDAPQAITVIVSEINSPEEANDSQATQ